MNKIFFLLALTFSQGVLSESISNEKKYLIDKMLTQMGQSSIETAKLFSNLFIDQMTKALKKAKPDIDSRAFDIVDEEIKKSIDEEFLNSKVLSEMMYSIYGNRFSESELKKLVGFYDTPLGEKLIRALPVITQEGMQAGQDLAQSILPKIRQRIIARLRSDGIEI